MNKIVVRGAIAPEMNKGDFLELIGIELRKHYLYTGDVLYEKKNGRLYPVEGAVEPIQLKIINKIEFELPKTSDSKELKSYEKTAQKYRGWLDSSMFRRDIWREGDVHGRVADNEDLLAFNNGVLDKKANLKFRPYTGEDEIAEWLEYDYDPEVPPDYSFLLEVVPKDTAIWLLKKLAYSLFPKEYTYIPMAIGEGSNGKTAFLKLVKKVFGKYCSNVPAILFSRDISEVMRGTLIEKTVRRKRFLLCDEMPGNLDQEFVKQMAGAQQITYNCKYSTHTHSFVNKGLLFFTGNEEPRTFKGEALFRRVKLISFDKVFKVDPGPGECQLDPHRIDRVNPMAFLNAVLACYDPESEEPEPPEIVETATQELAEANDPLKAALVEQPPQNFDGTGEPAGPYLRRVQNYLVDQGYYNRLQVPSLRLIGRQATKVWNKRRDKNGYRYLPIRVKGVPSQKMP